MTKRKATLTVIIVALVASAIFIPSCVGIIVSLSGSVTPSGDKLYDKVLPIYEGYEKIVEEKLSVIGYDSTKIEKTTNRDGRDSVGTAYYCSLTTTYKVPGATYSIDVAFSEFDSDEPVNVGLNFTADYGIGNRAELLTLFYSEGIPIGSALMKECDSVAARTYSGDVSDTVDIAVRGYDSARADGRLKTGESYTARCDAAGANHAAGISAQEDGQCGVVVTSYLSYELTIDSGKTETTPGEGESTTPPKETHDF